MTRAAIRALGERFDALRSEFGRDVAVEQLARSVLAGHRRRSAVRTSEVPASVEAIISVVAKNHGLALEDLRRCDFARQRSSNRIAAARGEAVYVVRALSDVSYPVLGRYFGRSHHSTLFSAREKFAARLKTDELARRRIERIIGDATAEERAVA